MPNVLSTAFLVAVLSGTAAYLIYAAKDSIKQLPIFKIKQAWQRLQSFEQHLVKAGVILFLPIPVIKNHVLATTYLMEFLVEFLPALASAMLITGVLALIRELHLESLKPCSKKD